MQEKMAYFPSEEDILRHRAFVAAALAKELNMEVRMDDSGYHIPGSDTFIENGAAEDILAKPRLMRQLKEQLARNNDAQ